MKYEVDIKIDASGTKPTVEVFDCPSNGNLACLWNWDVKEKMDGYTIDELNELIACLISTRNHMAEEEVKVNVV